MTEPNAREQQVISDPRGLTADETSSRDPLEVVLSAFGEEVRNGNTPSIDDYARRYPDLAEQIRELFPLVHGLEQWKSDREIECMRRNMPAEFSIKKLGDYELIRELGRGGMGVVFQAVHTTSQRSVAIKLLPWRFAADMHVWKDRLQREAATIAALQHPNIVPIYSFSEDQGYSYYVMQLVDGIGLDKLIDQLMRQRRRAARRKRQTIEPTSGTLLFDSWRGFAGIGEQVALALAYAHENGVCHNDIKPSNLLVRANRQVIVTDFGIGRLDPDDVTDTDDRAIGTLKYMAPERLSGPGSLQSDLYSLGVTLYELATQTPIFPFQKRKQLIVAILHEKPILPRRLTPDIPLPLEKIILKAMAKAPSDRYATARELAIDLRRFINREPIQSIASNPWQNMVSMCQNWMKHFWR
jgi:serine/threonine protein kinase